MLAQRHVAIGPNETSAVLKSRLAARSARTCLSRPWTDWRPGRLQKRQARGRASTYASRLERHESQVDWSRPALDVHNRIRGLQPWPMATVPVRGRRLRLLGSVPEDLDDEKHVGRDFGRFRRNLSDVFRQARLSRLTPTASSWRVSRRRAHHSRSGRGSCRRLPCGSSCTDTTCRPATRSSRCRPTYDVRAPGGGKGAAGGRPRNARRSPPKSIRRAISVQRPREIVPCSSS